MDNELKTLLDSMKNHGYKLTPQRKEILKVLISSSGEHLTCDEIYETVKKACPEMGIATVYRTLQILESTKKINKLNLDDGYVRYELNLNDETHNHHHLICKICGNVAEVRVDLLEDLENNIEKNYDFKIVDHDLKFFGICSKCKNLE
ncbi:Fur family transcriptional regulator [Proteocatella sphenisci]|uniref:Fur family transcriptional regulator n=1 Tax=Proteocatella sphenisci TaxID=181070 RepID=UPI00048B78DA|nr:Fur family transcriptional regulator [Proteocatella sphenisci]